MTGRAMTNDAAAGRAFRDRQSPAELSAVPKAPPTARPADPATPEEPTRADLLAWIGALQGENRALRRELAQRDGQVRKLANALEQTMKMAGIPAGRETT